MSKQFIRNEVCKQKLYVVGVRPNTKMLPAKAKPSIWMKSLKIKGLNIYIHIYMDMISSSLQFEVVYWPAMTPGGAAQVAATHCLNERTLDPAVCSYNRPTYVPASRTMAFTPQRSPATTHYF